MKCQACDQAATHHVTEIVAGEAVEYHVCDTHLQNLEGLDKATREPKPSTGYAAFWANRELKAALRDEAARQKVAAHLLPPLCLALLDPRPEVKVVAAFRLMAFGPDARSVVGALQNALQDADERVRQAARIALEYIQSDKAPPWFL
jgi:HEAT repeat protein